MYSRAQPVTIDASTQSPASRTVPVSKRDSAVTKAVRFWHSALTHARQSLAPSVRRMAQPIRSALIRRAPDLHRPSKLNFRFAGRTRYADAAAAERKKSMRKARRSIVRSLARAMTDSVVERSSNCSFMKSAEAARHGAATNECKKWYEITWSRQSDNH